MRSASVHNGRTAFTSVLCYCVLCLFCIVNADISVAEDKRVSLTQYSHEAWLIQNGAFLGSPNQVVQTSDGYLWVGTDSGLYRFDGVHFVPWLDQSTGELFSSAVYSLLPLPDGGLLIGGNGLERLQNGRIQLLGPTRSRINAIIRDKSGGVWISRSRFSDERGPLCKVVGDDLKCFGHKQHLECAYGSGLVVDGSGTIWMGSSNELCSWHQGKSETLTIAELKSQESLRGLSALAVGADDSLWVGLPSIGTHLGLRHLSEGVWSSPHIAGLDPSSLDVSELMVDHEGSLWIGTMNRGLFHLTNGTIDHFGSADGLTSDSVEGLYEDREQNIWVSTTRGLDRFHCRNVSTFSKGMGLQADLASSVSASPNGTVVVADERKLFVFRPENETALVTEISVPGYTTTSVLQDHNGELWVGVDDSLKVYKNKRFRALVRQDGSPLGTIRSLCEDKTGQVWALTTSKAENLYRIGPDYVPRLVEHLPRRAILMADDPIDGVWVTLEDMTLLHLTGKGPIGTAYGQTERRRASNLSVEPDGSLWLSQRSGLSVLTHGRWISLDRDHGLPCEQIFTSIRDKQNSLWLYASCGIIKVPSEEVLAWLQDPKRKVKYELFGPLEGAQTGEYDFAPGMARTPDGRLWFVNGDMLQMIDPGGIRRNLLPPPVQIEALVADHKIYTVAETVRLPTRTRDVEIDYAGLSFVTTQKVNFRYRLLGADNNWNDATTRRQAFYMNLGPGTYTFQVQASNNDGVWNEAGATIAIVIPPTLIQTVGFRVLLGVVALLLISVVTVVRIRQMSEAIRSQLSERMVERERIARELHDTLLQGFQGLILRFGTAARHIPKGEPSKAMMESALDRADEVLLEGRSRVRDLRADDVTSSDLLTALSNFSDELAIGQAAAFDVTKVGDERELHPIVREEAYWIGREALSNAQSHAFAKAIRLSLDFGPKTFVMTCADNGRGIEAGILEAGAREGHWGLSGMRERAVKIGGTVRITCDGEPGTRVTLRVPAAVAYRKSKGQSRVDRLKMLFR